MTLDQCAQLEEARLMIRWAAEELTDNEREVLFGMFEGLTDGEIAKPLKISRQRVAQLRESAAAKMRHRLCAAGIRKCSDLLETA